MGLARLDYEKVMGNQQKRMKLLFRYIFFSYEFQVKESEVIVAGGYLDVGGTILRDTDRYTLKGNGQINKQETGFLQKPRKYHRLTFLQILKSMLIKRNLPKELSSYDRPFFPYVTQKFSSFMKLHLSYILRKKKVR